MLSTIKTVCHICEISCLYYSRQNSKGRSSRGSWRELGGPERNVNVSMEFHLNKIRLQHEEYPANREQASRQIILIHEVEICDKLTNSRINKFLYHYSSSSLPRQSHSNMFLLKALHLRPDPKCNTEEICLKISIQPLRLNIDQDSLLFLRTFFTEISTSGNMKPSATGNSQGSSQKEGDFERRRSFSPPPVMKVAPVNSPMEEDHLQQLIVFDEIAEASLYTSDITEETNSSNAQPIFIRFGFCYWFSFC